MATYRDVGWCGVPRSAISRLYTGPALVGSLREDEQRPRALRGQQPDGPNPATRSSATSARQAPGRREIAEASWSCPGALVPARQGLGFSHLRTSGREPGKVSDHSGARGPGRTRARGMTADGPRPRRGRRRARQRNRQPRKDRHRQLHPHECGQHRTQQVRRRGPQLLVQEPVGSILDGAVTAWFSCRTVEGLQEDHAVTALPVYATPLTRACRTPLCWTQLN